MDSASGKASEYDRRASLRASVRLSVAGDDDDYDHDLHASPVVDGFRPAHVADETAHDATNDAAATSSSTLQVPDSPQAQRSRPSSIAKPPIPAGEADAPSQTSDEACVTLATPVPTNGAATQAEGAPADNSTSMHPYAMTTVTVPTAEPTYQGPTGPTHPYGLYDQTTVPVDGPAAAPIPIGFTNQDNYRRQIGPDGEDAGVLVGPLGHTEELPPYSRYPDEAYARKDVPATEAPAQASSAPIIPPATVAAESIGATVEDSNSPESPEQPIPGAGGIGLATRDPEYASTDDLDSPRSRLSTRSFTSDQSQHEINTAAKSIAEKPEPGKWQKRARKRMWGIIPYWVIFLLTGTLIVMGIILGAVIGTFLAGHRRAGGGRDDAAPQTLPSATMDAQPLTTVPPDLPPLDTGAWGLPPLIASQAPSTCFNTTTQAQAWSCSIPFAVYNVEVTKLPNQPPTSEYALKLTTPFSNFSSPPMNGSGFFPRYSWGTQPPLVPEPMKLILVNDTFEPGRGPAWWMHMTFNKTVILAQDKFPGPTNTVVSKRAGWGSGSGSGGASVGASERSASSLGGGGGGGGGGGSGSDKSDKNSDFKRKGMSIIGAQDGDKPWICTWPGTILEVFIYPAQNNSFKSSFPPMGPPPSASGSGGSRVPPFTIPGAPSPSPTTSSASLPPDANTATPTTSGVTPTSSSLYPFGPNPFDDGDWGDWNPSDIPSPPPPYPKVIKFEERRFPGVGPTTASCRQVEIINNGQDYKPVLDANNQPIEVVIVENRRTASGAIAPNTSPAQADTRRWLHGSDGLVYRDVPTDQVSDCGCIWWFT